MDATELRANARKCARAIYAGADRTVAAAVSEVIRTLLDELDRLEKERDEATKSLEEMAEPLVKWLRFEDGKFDAALTGPVVERMSVAIVGHFKALGAENYLEMSLFDRDDIGQRYTLNVQKVGAKSAHDFRRDAESRLASSEAALSETRDRAVKALEPFAEEADRLRNYPDDYPYSLPTTPITAGDFRLARKTRSELLEQMGGNHENRANSVGENTPA